MTRHTLGRTFASILAEVGVPPRRAMYLLGHTDPTLTMRVYQQVLDMGGAAVETLEKVLGCTLERRLRPTPGGMFMHRMCTWPENTPSDRDRGAPRNAI